MQAVERVLERVTELPFSRGKNPGDLSQAVPVLGIDTVSSLALALAAKESARPQRWIELGRESWNVSTIS